MNNTPAIFGTHDPNTLEQINDVASRAARSALMADGHLGYVMPIGGVAGYRDQVSVVGVGFDIACGNCAIRLDTQLSDLGKTPDKQRFMLERLADDIQKAVSFGVGRSNLSKNAPTDHALFDAACWNIIRDRAGHGELRRLKDKAREQLGTVGSGNHYVDVFVDEAEHLWVGVHFGSRGLGHGIATGFKNMALTNDWFDNAKEQEVLLNLKSSMGQDYWELMNLAGAYAYAGREWVARLVVDMLKGTEIDLVHNHHNFAWKEEHWTEHGEEELVVVRKGATPAYPGQRGFVGGSMGDNAVILKGRETTEAVELQAAAMYSTVHGAGRVMSRTQAAGKYKGWGEKRVKVSEGKISADMLESWLRSMNVILRGGGLDEAPQAYRRLPEVLEAQGSTIVVEHTLRPLIVVMAGANEFDPYKD